jgi:hypothetical protein
MFAIACLILAAQDSQQLVVLATHDLPSPEEKALLAKPLESWKDEAELHDYKILVDQETSAFFVHHENLYNLAAFDEVLRGVAILEACVRSGSTILTLGTIDGNARRGVQRLLSNTLIGREAGPLLSNEQTQIRISCEVSITISDGKRQVTFDLPVPEERPNASFYNQEPSKEDWKQFEEGLKSEVVLKPYSDQVIFSFSTTSVPSVRKTQAVQKFAQILSDQLESQFQKYTMAQEGLRAALLGDRTLPKEGQSTAALDDATQRFLKESLSKNAAAYGFESDLHMQAFLADAKIESVGVQPTVSVGILKGGQRVSFSVRTTFNRNPVK